jgi:hypothetical protein
MRRLIPALIVFWAILPAIGRSQGATPTYQCDGGPNAAIVNACAVRWEAANIRAHVAVNAYGGATPRCLIQTAGLLDDIAAKWLKRNAFRAFNGPWPCGKDPAIARADDGVLSQACPGRVWSYDNRGANSCRPSPRPVAQVQQYRPAPTPTPVSFDFDRLSNLIAGGSANFRWWDGGSVDAGDYHDRTTSNTALFTGCNFRVTNHESDDDGRVWQQSWTGTLRDANPVDISVSTLNSRPAAWVLRFGSTGRAALFQYNGSFKSADGNTINYSPANVTAVVATEYPYNPAAAVTALRAAIYVCKSSS